MPSGLAGTSVAKRLELEKAQEIEKLKKDLKDSQKQVKLGKSEIETCTRSMKKQVSEWRNDEVGGLLSRSFRIHSLHDRELFPPHQLCCQMLFSERAH